MDWLTTMALIDRTLYGEIDKVKMAIERIRHYDPSESEALHHLAPYYVCYSGGKDSDALRILFELSGVKYDLVHNHTTVDAPETVRYIRSIPGIQISKPEISMWGLIVKKGVPPTRLFRYCCEYLKERNGVNRFSATGVRWAESSARKTYRGIAEIFIAKAKEKLILNDDNDENRRLYEVCALKGRRVLNPIVDWSDDDVWEFLHHYGCESNPLYQCGYKRIGCIGCPMAREKRRRQDFDRYPKYKENYIHAFERMLDRKYRGKALSTWGTGQDVFDWWIADPEKRWQASELELFNEDGAI